MSDLPGDFEEVHVKTTKPAARGQLKLPHERDLSEGGQADGPRPEIKQAHDDMRKGMKETGRRSAHGLENPDRDVGKQRTPDDRTAGVADPKTGTSK